MWASTGAEEAFSFGLSANLQWSRLIEDVLARLEDQVTEHSEKNLMYHTVYDSAVGPLLLESDGEDLLSLLWPKPDGALKDLQPGSTERPAVFDEVTRQLDEYFAGSRRDFDLKLKPIGTDFQLRVWRELEKIPYAETISYGELARRIGNSNASRAVGAANGKNPISLIVP